MVRCCTFLLVVLVQHPQYHGIYMMFLLNTMVFMFGSTQTILQWISVSWFNRYPWIPQNLVTERKPIVSGGQTMWYPDIPHFETNPYMICIQYIHIDIYIYMLYVSTCSYSCSGFVFLMGYVSRWYAGACMLFLLDSREWNIPSFLVGQTSLFIGNILVRTSYVPVSISWSPFFGVVYPCLSILVTLYILYYCHKNKNNGPCFDISEQVQMKNNGHESYVT